MTPEEFWKILHDVPEPKPVLRRLYHDEQGLPLFYSGEDLPGNYIDISAEDFARASGRVRVVNGVLIQVDPVQVTSKLRPSTEGVACHPNDVCVIVDDDQPHVFWKKTTK